VTRPTAHYQRGLQYFNGCLYLPNSVDGTGAWDAWNPGDGTVTHATVGSAFDTQLKRTIFTNDGTADRALGVRKVNAGDYQFFYGNADNCGGFYYSCIARIGAWNSDAGRIFFGLSASANAIAINNTVPANTVGLWHDTGDGQDVFSMVVCTSGGAATKNAFTTHAANAGILAAGVTLHFEMWAFPNGIGTVNTNFRLEYYDATNKWMAQSAWSAAGLASGVKTGMMAPQCQMSNGADTTIGHYALEVANVYCSSWSGELF